MTDRSEQLAMFLVVESVRQSAKLRQHFLKAPLSAATTAEPVAMPAPGSWSVLTPDEITLGFQRAVNVIRATGFAAEAARLSLIGNTQGHASPHGGARAIRTGPVSTHRCPFAQRHPSGR